MPKEPTGEADKNAPNLSPIKQAPEKSNPESHAASDVHGSQRGSYKDPLAISEEDREASHMLGEDYQKNMVYNFCRDYIEENGYTVKGEG